MLWGLTIIFGILSVLLMSGRGSSLIAGYNTASAKERARYRGKRLCRVIGGGMAVITLLLAFTAFFRGNIPQLFYQLIPVVLLLAIAVMFILVNTICKSDVVSADEIPEEKAMKYVWLFPVVILAFCAVFFLTGKVEIVIEDEMLRIEASYWGDMDIYLSGIQEISYLDNLDIGKRTSGVGSVRLQEGHFKNEEYGSYTLYSYTGCESYVILETGTGIVVVNQKTAEETRKLYEQIVEKTGR